MDLESIHFGRIEGVEIVVAIDSTRRGPALGGCRWQPYPSSLAAREEASALARAMTRKAALARLRLGGGKAVVSGDPARRTRAQLLAFGELVHSLGGRYVTAADMGTGEEEMAVIREVTPHVVGLPARMGGCGEPAPFTAEGVCLAIEAALRERGSRLAGARVAVQGVGQVGSVLTRHLIRSGARVVAADPRPASLRDLPPGVAQTPPEHILTTECDVLAPCGPAGVIDPEAVSRLRCAIVCGAANNPLSAPPVAGLLADRGILYVPDYLANAGGLIHLAVAREGRDAAETRRHLRVIPENLERVLALSKAEGIDPLAAAERIALRG